MKALGCFVVVMAVAFAGFFALVGWSITRGDDQSALTEQVEATTVSDPRRVGSGNTSYRFAYAYEVDGQWYGSTDDGNIDADYWRPGDSLSVCVDPREPSRHVLVVNGACGEKSIDGGYIDEATPRPAP